MDDLDHAILQCLKEDASSTNGEIGARVGLTEAAVRRRVARLRSDGTIVRFTVVTRPLGPEGLVLVRCRPGRTGEILRFLQDHAVEVFETSGEFDLGAFIEEPTMERFNEELDRLRAVDGVVSTVTLVRLARSIRPTGRSPGSARAPVRAAPAPTREVRPTRSLVPPHRGRSAA
ncbi:MAG TPA: Lrp/AsnC family transcriptional regulator [Thermoplasmata archaeon]|nr:Lrp/AsnC family transcriptional regulator [Thermoplasmata archaeon]